MSKTLKYITSFIIISTLCIGGITCHAAIVSQDIGAEQFAVILGLSDFTYVNPSPSFYVPQYGSGTTTTGVNVHVRYDGKVKINPNTYTINIPLYLTGIDNGTIQFCLGSSESYISNLNVVSYNILVDGTSTTYTDGLEYLGSIGTCDFDDMGAITFDFKLWQISWQGSIDVLQINVSNASTGNNVPFAFGMTGASFLGADVQIATIVSQITNISQAIQDLKVYVDQVETNQITIIGKIEDVIAALQAINDLKGQLDQILSSEAFDAANGTTIVQNIQVNKTKQQTVLNDLRQYSTIINQYHDPNLNNKVDEVLDGVQGLVSSSGNASGQVVSGLMSSLTFGDISFVQILLLVFGIALVSYILFGKKA